MKRASLCGMLVFLLLFAVSATAQETAGSIEGIVKDTSGAVLPGVAVEARNPQGAVVSVTSDQGGSYRFNALAPGKYTVSAMLPGFKKAAFENVELLLGQVLKINFDLSVGLTEEVQVTAESPIIDVKQNAATQSITTDLIDRIPKGRNFTSVVQIAPGANDETRNGGIQFDGSSGSENRFVIDGMDTTNLQNGTSGKTVYTEFLSEVQIKTSGYAAEFGGSTGGVVNAISKSGGNQYRGSFGTYYRNEGFQSDPRKSWRINPFTDCTQNLPQCAGTPEFVATPDAAFDNWNPIGDIGGPIFRNRAWFYFGSSYDRTDNERTTTFRNSSTNPGGDALRHQDDDQLERLEVLPGQRQHPDQQQHEPQGELQPAALRQPRVRWPTTSSRTAPPLPMASPPTASTPRPGTPRKRPSRIAGSVPARTTATICMPARSRGP